MKIAAIIVLCGLLGNISAIPLKMLIHHTSKQLQSSTQGAELAQKNQRMNNEMVQDQVITALKQASAQIKDLEKRTSLLDKRVKIQGLLTTALSLLSPIN